MKGFWLRIRKALLVLALVPLDGWSRAHILRRLGWFHGQGTGCYFAITNFGSEPWLLSFGDNVYVAAGARFVTHDVSVHMVRAAIGHNRLLEAMGPIELGSNIFVGLNAILLPGIRICSNVVIGAGALVSSDITESGVYVGVPARRIMTFHDYALKLIKDAERYPWCRVGFPRSLLRQARERYFWESRDTQSGPKEHYTDAHK